jgi:hypothetical protein
MTVADRDSPSLSFCLSDGSLDLFIGVSWAHIAAVIVQLQERSTKGDDRFRCGRDRAAAAVHLLCRAEVVERQTRKS